ncbi:MAG: hypothetical protein K0B11_20855, partial [Mariniphaga sp.]|nr:hypothetical protein [Mariniphaga sp.]
MQPTLYKGIVRKLLLAVIFQSVVFLCHSQNHSIHDSVEESMYRIPYDLKPQEWDKVQKIWSKNSHPVRVHLTNDSVLLGQILNYNDSALILWSDAHSFFNPYTIDRHITMTDNASVRYIFDHSGFSTEFWKRGVFLGTIGGAGIGTVLVIFIGQGWVPFYFALIPAALGTGTGYLFDQARWKKDADESQVPINFTDLSDAEKKRFFTFPDGLPEKVSDKNRLVHRDSAAFMQLTFDDILAKSPQAKQIFRTTTFSIAGQYVGSLPAFNYPESKLFLPGFGLSARFNITSNLFSAYYFRYIHSYNIDNDYFDSSGFNEEFTLNNKSHTLSFQYAPITPDRFLTRRFEIAAGIGVSLNSLDFQLMKFGRFIQFSE